jgi:hypothetical protein
MQWEIFIVVDERWVCKVVYVPYVIKHHLMKTCEGVETRLQVPWH